MNDRRTRHPRGPHVQVGWQIVAVGGQRVHDDDSFLAAAAPYKSPDLLNDEYYGSVAEVTFRCGDTAQRTHEWDSPVVSVPVAIPVLPTVQHTDVGTAMAEDQGPTEAAAQPSMAQASGSETSYMRLQGTAGGK